MKQVNTSCRWLLNAGLGLRALPALVVCAAMVAGAGAAAEVAAGWTHSVAVRDGRVWTWGDNAYGQLGQPDAGRALCPRPVAGLSNVVAVSAAWHTLALTASGEVYAWGRNDLGQLGNKRFGWGEKEEKPVRVVGLRDIVAVAAGWEHSLALSRDGHVYAWGSQSHGQLGDGVRQTGTPVSTPQKVPGLSEVTRIAAGGQHSLALCRDGTVYAWGSNWNGQLGNGKIGKGGHSAVPRPVVGADGKGMLREIVAMAAGGLHSIAVAADGTVYAWGYNGTGQVPEGSRGGFWESRGRGNVALPAIARASGKKTQVFSNGAAVAGGYEATYVLDHAGRVHTAGWSMYGEQASGAGGGGNRDVLWPALTGREIIWERPTPGVWQPGLVYRYTDQAHLDKGVKDLEVVDRFNGAALRVGKINSGSTQVGDFTRNAGEVETRATLVYPSQAEAGKPLRCMLTRLMFGVHDGDNDFATAVQLRWTCAANNEVIDIPLDLGDRVGTGVLPAISNIVAVAGGMYHALALDRDGGIWAWGHNAFGQVGDGSTHDGTVAQKLSVFDEQAMALPCKPVVHPAADFLPPPEPFINVREHGAKGDGITLDQEALQRVIDECSRNKGGTIWLPPGNYVTGTLRLRDGVRLHLSAGATILAATNRDHFTGKALIQADNAANIAITGKGVIDARGSFVGARDWRHSCVYLENCRDVLLEGVSTINSGSWTQHYIRCVKLTIRNVMVRSALPGRNNDGIDICGCEQVRIEGCTVIADDDAIVIKSQTGDRENRDIMIVDNVCHTYRGAFKLGTETRGVYSNIVCRGLTCYGSKAIELYSVDGSETTDIVVEDVQAHDALVALNIRLGARLRPSYWAKGLVPKVGFLRHIRIRNVSGNIATRAWRDLLLEHGIPDGEWATGLPEHTYDSCVSGLPEHFVEDVLIEKLDIRVPGGGMTIRDAATLPECPEAYPHAGNFGTLPAYGLFVRHAKNVTLQDVRFTPALPDVRPAFAAHDAPGFNAR